MLPLSRYSRPPTGKVTYGERFSSEAMFVVQQLALVVLVELVTLGSALPADASLRMAGSEPVESALAPSGSFVGAARLLVANGRTIRGLSGVEAHPVVAVDDHVLQIVRYVHMAAMLISFAILVPVGISYGFLKIRYSYSTVSNEVALQSPTDYPMRSMSLLVNPREGVMFKRHRNFLMAAFALQVLGILLIALFKRNHFDSLHAQVGAAVFGAMVVQSLLGVFRPNKFSRGILWTILHRRLLPTLVMGGGLASIILGAVQLLDLNGTPISTQGGVAQPPFLVAVIVSALAFIGVVSAFFAFKVTMATNKD